MTRHEIGDANQFPEDELQSVLCSQGAGTSGTSTAVDNQASVIARVPGDILLIVFEKVVGENDWDEKLLEGNLWTIVAVNMRWRALALLCAGLWSKIHLTFPPDYYRDTEDGFDYHDWAHRCCRRTMLQLKRSGQHPLQVDLDTKVLDYYHDCGKLYRAFLRQVLVSLARSRIIALSGHSSLLRHALPSQTPKIYPLLHTLRVDTTRHDIFVEVPALRHISIFATIPPSPHLCTNLSTLEVQFCYTTPSTFVELLCHTKQLEKLDIVSLGLPAEYQPSTAILPPVAQIAHLERLQELDIAFEPVEATRVFREEAFVASIVLQHIRIPNVESIRLTKPSPDDLSLLTQCLSVSGNTSSVVKLNIWSMEEGSYPIGSLLAGLPGLQTLLVFDGKAEWCRALCDALIWTDEPSSENTLFENPSPPETAELQKPPPRVNVCPKLQRVIFDGSKLDSGLLQTMVTGRMGNPSVEQLQSVDVKHSEFTNDPPSSGNHFDWLQDLQAPAGPLVPSSIKW